MDFNRLTEKSQEAIRQAQAKAIELRQPAGGCRASAPGPAGAGGRSGAFHPAASRRALEPLHKRLVQEIEKLPKVSGGASRPDQIYVTNRLSQLFTTAEEQAKRLKDDYVSIEHLLLAAAEDQGAAGKLLREFGLNSRPADEGAGGSARELSA